MKSSVFIIGLFLSLLEGSIALGQDKTSKLEINVVDDAGKQIPCRIHLLKLIDPLNSDAKKPHRPAGLPFWNDHFVCDGRVTLSVESSIYSYEVERGPEWSRVSGDLVNGVLDGQGAGLHVKLQRIADMRARGWYCGDMHVHRPMEDIELLMRAEDLDVAPVITWWNTQNLWKAGLPGQLVHKFDGGRWYDVMSGEDERGGGALLYFGLDKPLEITRAQREHPSSLAFARAARQQKKDVWIDVEKPFWWDVPMWLSSGPVDSIGIANNHMNRSRMYPDEAWGRPRDAKKQPPPLGVGYYTQDIYYHALNCGLRIPPSAGSASGVLPNPVGYNRAYVQIDGELTYDKWWAGLKAGRSFVTNGPLLICAANGKPPGHVFKSDAAPVTLDVDVTMISQDRVPKLELIQDGAAVRTVDMENRLEQNRKTQLTFNQSGWFLIRAISNNPDTFRFASTAPFYVEIAGKPRISKASAEFFQTWQRERIENLKSLLKDEKQRMEVLADHEASLKFWSDLAGRAEAR